MRQFFGWVLTGVTLLLLIASAIPVTDIDAWWLRALGFPRVQIAIAAFIALVALVVFYRRGLLAKIGIAILAAIVVYQLVEIFPYTPLASYQALPASSRDPQRRFSVLFVNVMARNREPDALIAQIRRNSPDAVLLMETGTWWLSQLDLVRQDYPHQILFPADNGYGMILLSRRPFVSDTVRFLTEDSIPSIRATMQLPSSEQFDLYCVHPRPPVSASGTTEEEIVRIGREVRARRRPAIVVGDLNDVSWSPTTHRFQQVSGMLDPRVGRGTLPTFHVGIFFAQYPVDQVFNSPEWRVNDLRRLGDVNSDHYPVYVSFQYQPEALERRPETPGTIGLLAPPPR